MSNSDPSNDTSPVRPNVTASASIPSAPLKGALFGLAAFAVFSTHDALIKSVASMSVFQIAFFVVLFSFVPFSLFLAIDSSERSLRPRLPGLVALRCLFSLGSLLSAFYAFRTLPLAQVYTPIFSAPILITLLAIPILGEKVRLVRWIAILIGMAGVLVVLRPGQVPLSTGHLAALLAAACVACTAIVTRKIGAREHSVTLIIYPMLVNFTFSGICLLFVYEPMTGETMLTLAIIGVLSVVGQALMIRAYRLSEAQFVAPMQYSQMIWAILFGSIFFGEVPDRTVLLGALIIISSGLLFLWREVMVSVTKPVLRTRNLRISAGPQAIPSEADSSPPEEAGDRINE
ncbi:MAG: DMT family transporter [Gammaproteobacteria bacterium]|nr:DMT family transporter [Gammaproteobacteria bacterium]